MITTSNCEICGSKDNLKTWDNGSSWCFSTPECPGNKDRKKYTEPSESVGYIAGECQSLQVERRISKRTCEFFNYQIGVYNGQSVHIANYQGGAQKIRTPDKKFFWLGSKDKVTLFGKEKWNGGNSIIITEGEIDALSIAEANDCRWPVVSLANGAQSARKSLQSELDWLLGFKSIILCFDNDTAGKAAIESVTDLFPPGRLKIASLSEKDANDCLMKGKHEELTKLVFNAQEFRPDGIVWGSELNYEKLFEKEARGLSLPYPILDDKIRGLKTGRIYTIYAGTGCVDGDTEFFSRTGWKRIAEYQEGDLVLQYNQGLGQLVKPSAYLKYPCTELTHFETKYGISQTLCDDHEVVYLPEGSTTPLKTPFHVIKHSLSRFRGRIITSFIGEGREGLMLTDSELRVQVAVNADGYTRNPRTNRVHVRLKKGYKISRLRNLLHEAMIDFTEYHGNDGYTTYRFRSPLPKGYTSDYYMAQNSQLKIIAEESLLWDGNRKNLFRTTKKIDADIIQFAWSSTGMRASIIEKPRPLKNHTEYWVLITDRKLVGFRRSKLELQKVRPNDGFKYCFRVPSGMLILRNNNCIFVTGNCGKSTAMREIGLHLAKVHKSKVANIFLEEGLEFTVLSYIAMDNGVPPFKVEENPALLSKTQKETGKQLIENMAFYRHFGSLDSKRLFNLLDYLVMGKGIEIILLDHISILVSGMKSESGEGERRDLDLLLTNLRSFAERSGATIIAATQLKRKQTSYSDGADITESDSRGSGAIEHISDVIFSLNVNRSDGSDPNDCQLKIVKNRITGLLGDADLIHYDNDTGRYLPKKSPLTGERDY